MAENRRGGYDINDKWDACLDLGIRRFVYSSFAGAASALLFFRTPATRWASVAFGAGLGIGSAYTECSIKFDGASTKVWPVLTLTLITICRYWDWSIYKMKHSSDGDQWIISFVLLI
ncbi:hypothetical protein DCAR_0519879 [Daucus carota subsp. sativus]|uniref:MICOS complex subunit n=1 Tax=Daucus carota subsp. sativus TaxID=79200 RepID=A0AAF1AYY4_DAUCS|nr:hypothetical protein DCAR_0519879 [Daucus carota subsp. sativus]